MKSDLKAKDSAIKDLKCEKKANLLKIKTLSKAVDSLLDDEELPGKREKNQDLPRGTSPPPPKRKRRRKRRRRRSRKILMSSKLCCLE
jgi:hypothetical protein